MLYSTLSNTESGMYDIIIYPIDDPQSKYVIPIQVLNPFFTLTSFLLYFAIVFFGLLDMVRDFLPQGRDTLKHEFPVFYTRLKEEGDCILTTYVNHLPLKGRWVCSVSVPSLKLNFW